MKVAEGLGVLEEASQVREGVTERKRDYLSSLKFQVDPWTASEREQLARLISRLDAIGEVISLSLSGSERERIHGRCV